MPITMQELSASGFRFCAETAALRSHWGAALKRSKCAALGVELHGARGELELKEQVLYSLWLYLLWRYLLWLYLLWSWSSRSRCCASSSYTYYVIILTMAILVLTMAPLTMAGAARAQARARRGAPPLLG